MPNPGPAAHNGQDGATAVMGPLGIFARLQPDGRRLMLLLQAYVDESGHSDDPRAKIVTVAGPVTPEAKWRLAESEWRDVLAEFKVSALHMKEFAHSQGEFRDWRYKEHKRRALLSCLVEVIERHVEAFTGGSVQLDAYRALTPEQQALMRDPYFPALQGAIMGAALEGWWRQLPSSDPVQIVIANHPEFGAKAKELYEACAATLPDDLRRHLAPIVGFGSPSSVVGLQIADFLAYELNRVVTDGVYNPGVQTRWPMLQFLRYRRFNWLFFDKERLEERHQAHASSKPEVGFAMTAKPQAGDGEPAA